MIERLTAALSDRYAIERELGQGGMATVYLAADLKHDRHVALKVLKPELAAVVGADRFIAEIRTTANLQHPHILPLFDSGEADSFLWYAMPYVEGESLQDRIDREKQLPVDEAVAIAAKVLGALGAAHDAGIVHRDIKPANILIDSRGEPLVADFGIALAVQEAGAGRLTETGLSLGTPYYMSPEQATGDREPDARSDVYSLGCVLYEMLTGEPPFQGSTAQAVLGRILTGDVAPPTGVRKAVPANVEAAVLTALEKLPADRFGSAGEFGRALGDAGYLGTRAASAAGSGLQAGAGPRQIALIVAMPLILALGWVLGSGGASDANELPSHSYRLATLNAGVSGRATIAGDGTVIYTSTFFDRTLQRGPLMIKRPSDYDFTPLPDTDGAGGVEFSPDSRSIAFVHQDGVFRIAADGRGSPVLLLEDFALGLNWVTEDEIVAIRPTSSEEVTTSSIVRIDANGGGVLSEVETDRRVYSVDPTPLADGRWLVEFRIDVDSPWELGLLDPGTGAVEPIALDAEFPRWVAPGVIAYIRSETLFASRFDADRKTLVGTPVVVAESTDRFDVSATGDLVFVQAVPDTSGTDLNEPASLVWLTREGAETHLETPALEHADPSLSPDHRRIAYLAGGWQSRVLRVLDTELGSDYDVLEGARDLDLHPSHNPVWSPDGDSLIFRAQIGMEEGLWLGPADGSRRPRLVMNGVGLNPLQWLSDGTVLLAGRPDADVGYDLMVVDPAEGPESLRPLQVTPGINESVARVSPDEQWIAYWSDEGGEARVYLRRWPELRGFRIEVSGPVAVRLLSLSKPVWSEDSRTLYFATEDGLHEVVFEDTPDGRRAGPTGPAIVPLVPHDRVWDFDPTNQRFLLFRESQVAQSGFEEVRMITNWRASVLDALQSEESGR